MTISAERLGEMTFAEMTGALRELQQKVEEAKPALEWAIGEYLSRGNENMAAVIRRLLEG